MVDPIYRGNCGYPWLKKKVDHGFTYLHTIGIFTFVNVGHWIVRDTAEQFVFTVSIGNPNEFVLHLILRNDCLFWTNYNTCLLEYIYNLNSRCPELQSLCICPLINLVGRLGLSLFCACWTLYEYSFHARKRFFGGKFIYYVFFKLLTWSLMLKSHRSMFMLFLYVYILYKRVCIMYKKLRRITQK